VIIYTIFVGEFGCFIPRSRFRPFDTLAAPPSAGSQALRASGGCVLLYTIALYWLKI